MIFPAVLLLTACSAHTSVKGKPEARLPHASWHTPLPLPPTLPVADTNASLERRFVFDSQEYVIYLLEDQVPKTQRSALVQLSKDARNAIVRAALTDQPADGITADAKLRAFEDALVRIGETTSH